MKEITSLTLERWRVVLTRVSVLLEDYEYLGSKDVEAIAKQLDVVIDDIYALQKQQSKQKEQNNDRH